MYLHKEPWSRAPNSPELKRFVVLLFGLFGFSKHTDNFGDVAFRFFIFGPVILVPLKCCGDAHENKKTSEVFGVWGRV